MGNGGARLSAAHFARQWDARVVKEAPRRKRLGEALKRLKPFCDRDVAAKAEAKEVMEEVAAEADRLGAHPTSSIRSGNRMRSIRKHLSSTCGDRYCALRTPSPALRRWPFWPPSPSLHPPL